MDFEEDSSKDVQEAEEELPTAAEASEAVKFADALAEVEYEAEDAELDDESAPFIKWLR